MTLDPAILARIPLLGALDPGSVQSRPMSGHTNTMLALETPVGNFALRLPRPGAAGKVDRARERHVLRSAAALGATPPPLFFDETDGMMLTRMQAGRTVRTRESLRGDLAAAAKLGQLLRKLHDSPFQFPWTFRAAEVVTEHFAAIEGQALELRLLDLAAYLDESVEQRVPAHDDVHPGNILWRGQRPWLIDWEYAGMNDPTFDLATAWIELDLEEPAFGSLLAGWGRDDASWRARVAQQAALAHGIAGAWYIAQGRATADQSKVALGKLRLKRCDQAFRTNWR